MGCKSWIEHCKCNCQNRCWVYRFLQKQNWFSFRCTAEVPVSESLFFEPALLFTTKGYKIDNALIKGSGNINILELPLNLLYKFDVSSVKLFALAGPYVGFALSGKSKIDGQESEYQNWNQ
ncbi:MAG: outer membrane beta-barrel protein [Saprospiraceae bacterium]|nr:outer membrane beta-barrel protein [Saprospiraceae bacterium]